ncbi:MAG: glycosyltransferase family 2 protein [Acidobacteria bacterium]|nr:glycosyltransferase family 2 protein [Acidobacteriota bacterium]
MTPVAPDGVPPSATVSILTFNGEAYLERIITALEGQDYAGSTEILVVDSGSTDGTLGILARHPQVRVHSIPNSEFGHGRTRNLVAQLATGELVAYLTHDAVPVGSGWLSALLAPMIDDERIAAVVGRQIARPGALPMQKYDIARTFASLGPEFGITVTYDHGQLTTANALATAGFYSDVNSAARRSVLTGPVPYREVSYAEDQLFGRDVIRAGLRKAYAPQALVEHSNDLTVRELGARIQEETRGLRNIGTAIPPMSRGRMVKQIVRGWIVDTVAITADHELGTGARFRALVINPVVHVVKWSNYRTATLHPAPAQDTNPS